MKSRLGAKRAGSCWWADPNDPAHWKKAEIPIWSRIDSSVVLLCFAFLIHGLPYGLRGKRHNALNCG